MLSREQQRLFFIVEAHKVHKFIISHTAPLLITCPLATRRVRLRVSALKIANYRKVESQRTGVRSIFEA